MIYLDNAATTFPKPEAVYRAMDRANRELAVNAGRGSYKAAREASHLIADTKAQLRDLVHVDISASVVLTSSVTIALNQILNGFAWSENAVVYLSPYEHNAVARTLHRISKKQNIQIKFLPLTKDKSEIDIEAVKYAFSKDKPSMVVCTHISNVTGYILPVGNIFTEAKKYNCITVLDSAQSLGLVEIDVRQLPVDIIAFASHKTLYGPFGIGGFVNVTGVPLDEWLVGGTGSDSLNLDMPDDDEGRYESASTNIVAVSGLHEALSVLRPTENFQKEKTLTKYLAESLRQIRGCNLYLPPPERHIGVVSFTMDGMQSEDVGMILDEDYDIAVRTGYHCAPFIHEYLGDRKYGGTVRVGLGQFNTESEIRELVAALGEI